MQEEEINVQDNKYEAMENLFQLESVDWEVVFACNLCDEGYYTETSYYPPTPKDFWTIQGRGCTCLFKKC